MLLVSPCPFMVSGAFVLSDVVVEVAEENRVDKGKLSPSFSAFGWNTKEGGPNGLLGFEECGNAVSAPILGVVVVMVVAVVVVWPEPNCEDDDDKDDDADDAKLLICVVPKVDVLE